MTKTRKSFLALFIIFTMLFSYVIPISSVTAVEINKPDGAEWLIDEGENHVWYKLDGTTLTIGGSGAMPNWDFSTDADNKLSFLNTPWRDKETHYFKNITKVEIKEGITGIGNNSFSLAKNTTFTDTSTIKEVILPESLTTIGGNAFKLNKTLEKIEFPSNLTTMDYSAFQDCGLKEVVLPESLKELSAAVFLNNEKLEQVTLPSELGKIGIQAFNNCNHLETIISYNAKAPTLGSSALKKDNLNNLTIPNGSLQSYKTNWGIDETKTTINYLYNITVSSNDETMGTAFANEKMALKDAPIELTSQAKTGYHFVGWESQDVEASTGKFNMPEKDVNINAKFEVNKYDAVFNSNGGTVVNSQEVIHGNKIDKPANPTKNGYTFDDWYEDEELNNKFDFDTTITKATTLYAKWIANEYKVTFDANGGTVTQENKNVIFESTYGDLPVPRKDGYTFDGWYTAKENGTKITSDTIVSITEAQTVYAKWINTYAVTFKDGENVLFTRSNITSGEKVTRPEANPSKEGYDFKGWYADATLTTEYNFDTPITENTYIYAKYKKTQENPPMPPVDELEDIELDVTFNDFSGFVKINDKMNDGVSEADSYKGTYIKVGYTTSDKTNKIYVIPSFGESRVKDVTINGTKYSRGDEGVEVSPEDGLIVTIAGTEKYTIIANPDKDTPTTRTIIWANSDYNEDAKPDDYNEDAVLLNGKAKVVAIYDEDGNKVSGEQEVDENGLGWITASENQKVVFEFTPNYGYQLTKILANGFELEAQDALNQYIFTMPNTDVHFAATFTKVDDKVKANSKKVASGEIILANNELNAGTARLSVKDIELSNDKVKEFKNAAGEYEIKSYLDIDLDQIFYKGSNDESDVWEKKIDTLSNKATITLKLADGITADDIVIVHNIHDGENYEIIEIESYDPETNTITFKTNSFSNYAIATKTTSIINNDIPTNTNDNPKTGDSIYVYISLMAFAMVGIIITTKSLKKSK